MNNPFRRLLTLPFPAMAVVLVLALIVPTSVYAMWGIREWQLGGSLAALRTERFFWGVWLGRGIGGVLLAILLLYHRRPAAVAITITAVWQAGPPLTFLLRGIVVLSASAGQSSGSGGIVEWLMPAALLPSLVTAALLIPQSVRRAFAIS